MIFRETSESMDPLDMAEQIAINHQWAHERSDDYRLVISRTGLWTSYAVLVEDEEDRLRFKCAFEFTCPDFAEFELYRLLNLLNGSISPGALWYAKEGACIEYRTDLDFSDMRPISSEEIERCIEAMVATLEQFYPCVQSIAAINAEATEGSYPGLTAEEVLEQTVPPARGRS